MAKRKQITTHFTYDELIKTDTGLSNDCPDRLFHNLEFVANRLEDIRSAYNKPIYVNSCFRTQHVNREVGGSPTSLHLAGLAVDIRITNYSVKQLPLLFQYILDTAPYELYPISRDVIHISWHPQAQEIENNCLTNL